jgi:LAGLIDADG endonuclease
MKETEMGYRGSKSEFLSIPIPNRNRISVKEQRVDGSYCTNIQNLQLRCTLMGFERYYQTSFPSKQISIRTFSTSSFKPKLNPWFVTGIIDAEGTFCTTIYKNKAYKTGWVVRSFFEIGLNQRDSSLVYQLKDFFEGIGTISLDKKTNVLKYSTASLKDLSSIVVPHFKKYPLLTQKGADFLFFEQIVELMNKGVHLTINGLQQVINIRASMNTGLSEIIKSEFSNNINPVKRGIIQSNIIPDPQWISGFVSGEGNLDVGIKKSKNIIGYQVYLRFRISQHARDAKLMELIMNYLGAGRLERDSRKPVIYLVINKISEINQIVIPFFNQYPICGIKHLDYLDWCKIANLIESGAHLTNEGLAEIQRIKDGINTGRKD